MSKFLFLLDSGHSGQINGVYQTCPGYDKKDPSTWHKMYIHEDGTTIFEGVFNRQIKTKLMGMLHDSNIDYFDISPGEHDMPLRERVERADDWYAKNKNSIFISIHGNAGKGRGIEIFTSVGQTRSDKIAEIFAKEFVKEFPMQIFRKDLSDGDLDKEANFYVLRKTDCPALLTENFFFDNYTDAKLMLSEEGQERIALAHFNAIKYIEKNGY